MSQMVDLIASKNLTHLETLLKYKSDEDILLFFIDLKKWRLARDWIVKIESIEALQSHNEYIESVFARHGLKLSSADSKEAVLREIEEMLKDPKLQDFFEQPEIKSIFEDVRALLKDSKPMSRPTSIH